MTTQLRLLAQPCTVRYWSPAAPPDPDNNPDDQWTEVASLCSVQQKAGRSETGTMGDLASTAWLVFLRPELAPPHAADQLVVQGLTLEFVGDCWSAYLYANLDHLEGNAVSVGP